MRKFLLYVGLIGLVVGGVLVYNYTHRVIVPGKISSASPWQPVRLRIPAIHVDAQVINVGRTSQGLMDAPVSQALNSPYWTHVFWYSPGAAPGQVGNSVIAGHVDRVGGDPAVFWFLRDLAPGNDIFVTALAGQERHFVVDRVVAYPATASSVNVLTAVFGSTGARRLNLITCSGVWTGHGYDERLVVFTTLVN